MENKEEFDDDVGDFLEISEEPVIKEALVKNNSPSESTSKEESDLKTKLTKEVKDHNITKKTLIALKEEYKNCKEELRIVHEKKKD